jgi:hypothetical protein
MSKQYTELDGRCKQLRWQVRDVVGRKMPKAGIKGHPATRQEVLNIIIIIIICTYTSSSIGLKRKRLGGSARMSLKLKSLRR